MNEDQRIDFHRIAHELDLSLQL